MGFLLRLKHWYFSSSAQLGDERGVDKGSDTTPLGRLDNSTLYDMANIKFDVLKDYLK